MRFGYLVSHSGDFRKLVEYKRYGDLTSPLIIQKAIHSFISLGRYQNHIETSRRIYRKRRDLLIREIRENLRGQFDFFIPRGGIFLWLDCRNNLNEKRILEKALEDGVKLAPGSMFRTASEPDSSGFRLNFASLTEEEINCGIRKLARALLN